MNPTARARHAEPPPHRPWRRPRRRPSRPDRPHPRRRRPSPGRREPDDRRRPRRAFGRRRCRASRSCARSSAARSTWPRPVAGSRRSTRRRRSTRTRPMTDDALERVLRLVAEGRLTADEAGPILDALEARADLADARPRDDATRDQAGDRRHADGPHRPVAPSARIRIEVSEQGRKVVNLRVPLALGRAALDRIPGLSEATTDRIREAHRLGHHRPDRRCRRRRRRRPDRHRMNEFVARRRRRHGRVGRRRPAVRPVRPAAARQAARAARLPPAVGRRERLAARRPVPLRRAWRGSC